MGAAQTSTDRALVFAYKVRRKLLRELRKRFTPRLVRHDLGRLASQGGEGCPRMRLLKCADHLSGAWPTGRRKWLDEAEAEALLAKANDILEHRFDLLGSGPVDGGDPVDWHRDLKTGFRWPADHHHLTIAWDRVPAGTDIKMPWELSRCQHFVTLALADREAPDSRYYEEFKRQTGDWIKSNPCGFGVNWVCAMDVAFRAVNWLSAAALFRERIEADEGSGIFFSGLVESLWLHGRHIARNLEWQGPRSASLANHFLADLCGLMAVGILFRDTDQGGRWLDFGRHWFEREALRQVFDDGANFETSISYHRLSHEMFLWAETIGEAAGKPFNDSYAERLDRMQTFVRAYTSPSGQAAQFGDNDGGRLLWSGIGDPGDHRYLLKEAPGFGGRANQMLLTGGRCLQASGERHAFERGGYWFGQVGKAWLGVRAGVVSHGGAHAHADQLSFVLSINGCDVIVDPGTGTYSADAEKRNTYRSSASHNAPRLNEWEANGFQAGLAGLFRMADDTRCEVLRWDLTADRLEFEARHHGFSRFRGGSVVTRSLRLSSDSLEVVDIVSSQDAGDVVDWSFRFAPGISVETVAGNAIVRSEGIDLRFCVAEPVHLSAADAPFSPTYGKEIPVRALHLRREVERRGDSEYRMTLSWKE